MGTLGLGGSSTYSCSRYCECPIPVPTNGPGKSDDSWQGGETPSNACFAEVDPKKQEIE